jgi:hypothetical protein
MEKKLKRRQEDEGRQGVEDKTRRSREESPSQEDESDRPHHLEFIHPTSRTKPKNTLMLFLLSV